MLIPSFSQTLFNSGMKFVDEIRRENLAALAKRLGGNSDLAQKLDRTESQVSQWVTGSLLPSGRRRGMRPETARWIEATAGLPPGWLDQEHPESTANAVSQEMAVRETEAPYTVKPRHARPLVQTVCDLAEQINDDGLRELIGFARCLTGTNPAVKEKAA